MHIAVLSDSHGRHDVVTSALDILRGRGIDVVLHCGDIDDPATVELFRGFTAHFVFGNCDVERTRLRAAAAAVGATLHGDWGHLEQDGVKIAFLHGHLPELFRDVEHSGQYDFVFYGHTHVAREHRTGSTRVVNPGALHRARPKTFAVLDLATRELETIEVE